MAVEMRMWASLCTRMGFILGNGMGYDRISAGKGLCKTVNLYISKNERT